MTDDAEKSVIVSRLVIFAQDASVFATRRGRGILVKCDTIFLKPVASPTDYTVDRAPCL